MGKTVCVRGFFFTSEEWRALDVETRSAIMGSGTALASARRFLGSAPSRRAASVEAIPLPPT